MRKIRCNYCNCRLRAYYICYYCSGDYCSRHCPADESGRNCCSHCTVKYAIIEDELAAHILAYEQSVEKENLIELWRIREEVRQYRQEQNRGKTDDD